MLEYWWFSSLSMTLLVVIHNSENKIDHIIETPPIARKFLGQPMSNLEQWMKNQGGFRKTLLSLEVYDE